MKHMKKNDGYVMVYVLIVFTILSFVAVSICTMAVKNLQAQKATINRMEARYEAEGYLQEFMAETELLSSGETVFTSLNDLVVDVNNALTYDSTDTFPLKSDIHDWNEDDVAVSEGNNSVYVNVTAFDKKELHTVQIQAVVCVPVLIYHDDSELDALGNPIDKYTYMATGEISYISYDISYKEVSE